MRRTLLLVLAGGLVLVLVAAAGGYLYLRQSLPATTALVQVRGAAAPIEIVRDADAIPHIYADTKLDALFGLGYVHAQDRLWQMEFQRRVGFGRLSEVLGAATLPQDQFLRTVGFGRAARMAWDRLPPETRKEVDAYTSGINAFLASHHGRLLPPEFTLLRFEPEPWTGPDVVVWQKMMAWDLSGNYSYELLRHDLIDKVGEDGLADMMPPYDDDGLSITGPGWAGPQASVPVPGAEGSSTASQAPPSTSSRRVRHGERSSSTSSRRVQHLERSRSTPAGPPLSAAFAAALAQGNAAVREVLLGGPRTEALGSNNWVVDGTMTASGKPLLANDPHLTARAPSIWYLAHVSGGGFDAIGATIPGTPAIVLGRNRFIAWGATNVAADVEDLYREKIDNTGRFAEFRNQPEPLQFVSETIKVKGQDAVHVDVRVSRHGPLISDAINAMNQASPARSSLPPLEPLAFRWTALDPDDTTLVAMMRMSEARNWSEFTAALRLFVVPSQNFVYADVDGHIGYYAPGRFPIRDRSDGTVPADGWSGDHEWTGWVPFDALPHSFDPPEHRIVTANNRPAPTDYPFLLGVEWTEPFRAQRIHDRLRQQPAFTTADFAAIQADTLSLHAKRLLPVLLNHVLPNNAADADAIRILRRWNYDARGDSAAAAIFQAWYLRLASAFALDDVGPLVMENFAGRFSYVSRFVARVLESPSAGPRNAARPSGPDDLTAASSPGRAVAVAHVSTVAAGIPTLSRMWCDDQRTPPVESCSDAVSAALDDAVADLAKRMRGDMERWRWDSVHRAIFPHQGLDGVALLRPYISRSAPNGGDWSTIDVGPVAADHLYEQRSVAGYREVIDLSPANDSRFADALGQSGHPLSRHYDDALPDWMAVRHRRMRMERADVEKGALGHLRLTPDEKLELRTKN